MKVHLREITEEAKVLQFDQSEGWVRAAVERADETLSPNLAHHQDRTAPKGERTARVDFDLRVVDDVYIVNGNVHTSVRLFCSRCGKPYSFTCQPKFNLTYSQDKDTVGLSTGGQQGHSLSKKDLENPELDYDISYLSEDFIDLSDIVSEQLQLALPFQPLCNDECQGVCANCGTNLNEEDCKCEKTSQNNPFAGLKDFRIQ